MTKQLAGIMAGILATLLALLVLWQFRTIAIYVLVSLALAAALRPAVKGWLRQSLTIRFALILLSLVVLISFGFLLFLGGALAAREMQPLIETGAVQDEWQLPLWLKGRSFEQALTTRLPSPGEIFKAFTGDQGQFVLPAILGFTQEIADVGGGLLIAVVLSLYWGMNQLHFERLWLSLLPSGQRKQARDIWRTIESYIGAYIRSAVVQSILAALFLGIGYWLLGSPYSMLLALFGALAWLIPVVGAPLAVILPLLIGLLTSAQLSLLTALYTLVVFIALRVWVEPRLCSRKWDNPILTLVILLALADAFGLLGILVAPPLSAICQILWNRLVSRRAMVGDATQISDLKERQTAVLAGIRAMDEAPLPLVTSSMERLTRLIEQAEPILAAAVPEAEQ